MVATNNGVQVDHILPWSRFGDDSFNNKTLCVAGANQAKKGRTPYEWFASERTEEEWDAFVQRIEPNRNLKGFKKRNLLLKNAAEVEERFRTRNLNDTRYAAKILADAAKLLYPHGERQEKGGVRRVFVRPGAVTAALRRAWGLEPLKKVNGERVRDDRHHALDALVVAATTERELQRITKTFQRAEQQGIARPLQKVEMPWEGFRDDVIETYGRIRVARPERRRARGEGHAATIRQVSIRDGKDVVFERKPVANLTAADLGRVKDPERNAAIVEAIREWIEAGKPANALPRSPRGDIIGKIRLEVKKKPSVMTRDGTADRGAMIRVDVFSKKNRNGKDEWYLVPIYPHQVADKKGWPKPPNRAVVAHKEENEWTEIGHEYAFRFSLYPRSYVEVTKPDGQVLVGYFAGLDRSGGQINLANHRNPTLFEDDAGNRTKSLGAKTLLSIKKYNMDRFGNCSETRREVRTWRGKACTSLTRHPEADC